MMSSAVSRIILMNRVSRTAVSTLGCVCISLLCAGTPAQSASRPQDGRNNLLAELRQLYEAADYEGALGLADEIDVAQLPTQQRRDALLYVALCRLAMGDRSAADAAVERMLHGEPLFQLSDDMPNRLRLLVDEVRARLIPALAQDYYRTGKASFENKDYASAVEQFAAVLELTQRGGGPLASGLDDLRMLAAGFLDLSRAALRDGDVLANDPVAAGTSASAGEPVSVQPPVAIRQQIPPWPRSLEPFIRSAGGLNGLVELVIDEFGQVAEVRWLKRVHPAYEALLERAAKEWAYEPARQNGEPVPHLMRLDIRLR